MRNREILLSESGLKITFSRISVGEEDVYWGRTRLNFYRLSRVYSDAKTKKKRELLNYQSLDTPYRNWFIVVCEKKNYYIIVSANFV